MSVCETLRPVTLAGYGAFLIDNNKLEIMQIKCPRCDGEMVGKVVDEQSCYDCGLHEQEHEYMDAVNVLLSEAAEVNTEDASEEVPKFPASVEYVCCECTCGDYQWRKDWLYEAGHFARRFVNAQQVGVSSFEQDHLGNIIAQTDSGQEVTITFDSGEPTAWICKHIISAVRLWVRREYKARHVLIHWQGDEEVAKKLKWAKHQGTFQPIWYQLDRNVFVVIWND